jgi:hypothetical protein
MQTREQKRRRMKMESHETVAKIARAFGRSLWFLAFCCLFMPSAAFASKTGVTCVVTQTSTTSDTVTITEPLESTGIESSNCKVSGVFLPTSADKVNVLEAGIPLSTGASDTLLINPGGIINVESDGEGTSGLVTPFTSGLAVTEGPEGTFTPVTWMISGTKGSGIHQTTGTTTYVFFSDVTPEPGTMLLFGTGLVALGFILRRRLAV